MKQVIVSAEISCTDAAADMIADKLSDGLRTLVDLTSRIVVLQGARVSSTVTNERKTADDYERQRREPRHGA